MPAHTTRVEWSEGTRQLIAEKHGRTLEVWERDSWEVRWFRSAPNAERMAKAHRLFRRLRVSTPGRRR
jgi:hypothetical protein